MDHGSGSGSESEFGSVIRHWKECFSRSMHYASASSYHFRQGDMFSSLSVCLLATLRKIFRRICVKFSVKVGKWAIEQYND